MKQKMLRILCWMLLLCGIWSASACADDATRMELSAQIEALPEFLLPGVSQGAREVAANYLSALRIEMDFCVDARRGLLIEMTLRHKAEPMATLRIMAAAETIAFSSDLLPAGGWYRIAYGELEALYPALARRIAPLREVAKAALRGEDAEAAKAEQAQREALRATLLEKAGEWLGEHPQALREADSAAIPPDQQTAARQYALELSGRDLVAFNNKVFESIMASEWVRRELRPLVLDALPGVEIGEEGLEQVELEIMRELKRQLAVTISGMHRPLYGKVRVDEEGRITDANLTSEPLREGALTLWAHYERMSGSVEQWLGQASWRTFFRASNAREALNGRLKYWRTGEAFELAGDVSVTGVPTARIACEATLRGEQADGATVIVLSAKAKRLAELGEGSLTLRIADGAQAEWAARFPDAADCLDLGHAPPETLRAFEEEMAAAKEKFIARAEQGMPPALRVPFRVLLAKI